MARMIVTSLHPCNSGDKASGGKEKSGVVQTGVLAAVLPTPEMRKPSVKKVTTAGNVGLSEKKSSVPKNDSQVSRWA